MPSSISFSTIFSLRAGGHLLACFHRAPDADTARMALSERGHDEASLYRCSDRELLRNLDADAWPAMADRSAAGSPQDCHWLLMTIETEELSIAVEYLIACGAKQAVYCKSCSNERLSQARIDMLSSLGRPFVLDEPAPYAEPIAEFHPVPWRVWTRGAAGASNG